MSFSTARHLRPMKAVSLSKLLFQNFEFRTLKNNRAQVAFFFYFNLIFQGRVEEILLLNDAR